MTMKSNRPLSLRNGCEQRQLTQIKALYAAYNEMRLRLEFVDAELERFRRQINRAAARVAKGG